MPVPIGGVYPLRVHERDGATERDSGSAEHWRRIKGLFLEALDRSESERAEYLTRACEGNEALRREVEALLASDEAAGSFCETPASHLLASAAPDSGDRTAPLNVNGDLRERGSITNSG